MKRFSLLLLALLFGLSSSLLAQQKLFIPMDASQRNHLKAYGIVFNYLKDGNSVQWLLNYKGGSFMAPYSDELLRETRLKNVKAQTIGSAEASQIISEVEQPDVNTSVVQLDKAPKIAVYTPKQALPWDDAVTLALTYAEVEYDKVWDPEVLNGKLSEYDWLHMHHEDFTGQYGKFWVSYRNHPWYITQVNQMEKMAGELGYNKVSRREKR
ncbi:MAG: hypothetical protein U5K69_24365 [Balneolaceae bacterium]|nr:hypothetical protein [Balneolaceae bacterium]